MTGLGLPQRLHLWRRLRPQKIRVISMGPTTPQCNPKGILELNEGSLEGKLLVMMQHEQKKSPLGFILSPSCRQNGDVQTQKILKQEASTKVGGWSSGGLWSPKHLISELEKGISVINFVRALTSLPPVMPVPPRISNRTLETRRDARYALKYCRLPTSLCLTVHTSCYQSEMCFTLRIWLGSEPLCES